MDRGGGVLAFGRDGQKTWSIKLGAEVVGRPCVRRPSLVILTSDGVLHLVARADGRRTAIAAARQSCRPAVRSPPGRDAMIPVAPGTIPPDGPGPRSPGKISLQSILEEESRRDPPLPPPHPGPAAVPR